MFRVLRLPISFQPAIHCQLQFLNQERLREERQIVRFEKFQSARSQSIPGDENYPLLRRTSGPDQRLVKCRAVETRHAEVAKNQIVCAARKQRQSLLAVKNGFHLMTFFAQNVHD
jgi:hypothetical protein